RPLREGLDRILQANMGALIVVGDGPEVLAICSGGFLLDAEFTPQRLSELAKMDGAIILASDASRIARANVHLVPNPHVPTSETGTRHRTAERVARSIPVPVISVSEDMSMIAVYVGDLKHPLEPIQRLLNRANQALQTLERYKNRLDTVSGPLSALADLSTEDLLDLKSVMSVLRLPAESGELDMSLQPRGYRLLSKIPRLPDAVIERIVQRFGNLQKIMRATIDDLDDVEGVGST